MKSRAPKETSRTKKKKIASDWEATALYRVRDGFLLYVALANTPGGRRWRYNVSPIEYLTRGPNPGGLSFLRADQFSHARGYMGSRERAMCAAEAACDGLLVAVAAGEGTTSRRGRPTAGRGEG